MQVKLLPDIFPEAHRLGEGALLRVWYLARTVSAEHYRIRQADLVQSIVQYLHVKERYANQLLESGDNLWWRLDHKHGFVYMLGAKTIYARLNCPVSNVSAIQMPLEQLAHLKSFYAFAYAAYLQSYVRGNRSLPVARATLMEIFGVTRNTLRSWEKAARVTVISNYAFATPNTFRDIPDRHVEYHCKCGAAHNSLEKLVIHQRFCQERDYVLVWDRPNSYIPQTAPTIGIASPVCSSRMAQYQRRHDRKPNATKCEHQLSSPSQPPTHSTSLQTNEVHSAASFRYRAARVSDPLPGALLRKGVSLKRIARALCLA